MVLEIPKIIRSGLSRKLAGVVLFSIVLVEFIILFPSVMSFKHKQVHMVEMHADIIVELINSNLLSGKKISDNYDYLNYLNNHSLITGYKICFNDDCKASSGEAVVSTFDASDDPVSKLVDSDTRLEVRRSLFGESGEHNAIIMRIDTSDLKHQITMFIWQMIGLVALISVFVTIASMIGVSSIVISPILKLKENMFKAMEDPTRPGLYYLENNQMDEIADLTQTYNRLLFDINHYQNQLTESKREIERGLSSSEARWKFALEGSGDGVWDWNPITDKVFFSSQIKELLGYPEGVLEDTMSAWLSLVHPEDRKESIIAMNNLLSKKNQDYSRENRVRHKDGHWIWILSRGMVITRDSKQQANRVVGTHTDISSHKQAEALIWSQANLDLLTNLPNRRLFQENLCSAIETANRNQSSMALIFLDLDNFKIINDTHGHKMGDVLLQETAKRLKACVRDNDIVSRLGGDEFTIIINNVLDMDVVTRIAENVLHSLCRPFALEMESFHISASIGITSYPEDASDTDTLLMNADQAMYVAKEQGRNRYAYFTQSMRTKAQTRMRTINELRQAIVDDEFELYFQPIVDMQSGLIVKTETLIRWRHPVHGLLGADNIIPIAEETGLIVDIGNWVFYEATKQQAKWRKQYDIDLQVSVNTSPAQYIDDRCVVNEWFAHMDKLGLPYDSLVVEITEGMLLELNDSVEDKLAAFRKGGVKIALDDFGTGYSSLSYLQKLTSDYLKIDRSFVSNITESEQNMALCCEIIHIAHIFGMKVIAEGIETEEQSYLLALAGCDFGQGYLYAKPLTAAKFEEQLAKQCQEKHTILSQPFIPTLEAPVTATNPKRQLQLEAMES
jgi:diguanylate cyclase (GGDEF)-like protein/PAS domain S-box-containing protein